MLDGKYINFPDDAADYGYISDGISGEDCQLARSVHTTGLRPHVGMHPSMFLFPQPSVDETVSSPELTILFSQKFTSVGLLLTFNMMSGDYPTRLRIRWYSDGELLSDMEFHPDSVRYFCNNYVRLYDKIAITFYETSRPWRPVFITRIDYGIYRDFSRTRSWSLPACRRSMQSVRTSASTRWILLSVLKRTSHLISRRSRSWHCISMGSVLGTFI